MQIEVAFVNRPSKNPKFGSIKGTDGIYYSIGADVLDRYRKGMVFDAPVSSREYQGKTYYSIPDSFDPVQQLGGTNEDYRTAARSQPNGHAPAQALVAQARGGGYVDKDLLITTTALMKSFIETGQFGVTDLETLLEPACTASAKRLVKAAS
jgi:hypothetical protein